MIRVFVTDDHQIFIDGISALLRGLPEIEVVGSATNGQATLDALAKVEADALLLDMNMPGLDGLTVATRLRHTQPDLRLIMLTMEDDPDTFKQALAAGVHGFLLKNTGQAELQRALQSVCQGGTYYAQQMIPYLASGPADLAAEPATSTLAARVSPREKQVLEGLALGHSTAALAQQLKLGEQTIQTYRKSLLKKFGAKNVAHLISLAKDEGLI